jgi:hypothetical protein
MFAFVGCSYSPWPLVGYKDAFSEVMKSQTNVLFEFADVRIANTWILDKVRSHIERSDVGLFDITFLNPNVLLELGIAVGMKKRAFILVNSQHDDEGGWFKRIFAGKKMTLPVNLQGLELVKYSNKQELTQRLGSIVLGLSSSTDASTLSHSSRVKEAVLKIVRGAPGLGIRQIESKSGETIEFVRSALSRLRKEGLVKTKGSGTGTQYYPATPKRQDRSSGLSAPMK